MRTIGTLTVIAGLAAMIGCGGDDGNTGVDAGPGVTPTASGVFPAQAFTGRNARVEITGDATTWTAASTVAFGDGVTVNSVSLASPTSLFADITIAPTATTGLHDVVVTAGTESFTLSKAFEVDAPASTLFAGLTAQGSISEFTITSTDIANPFDTTSTSDEFGDLTFTNIAITGPAGVSVQLSTVTAYSITGVVLTDVDAAVGSADLSVASGPVGGTIITSDAGSINVASRKPTALVAGTAVAGNIANAFDSDLYSFTPGTAPDVQSLAVSSTVAGAGGQVAVLPASGHFADLISFGPTSSAINATAGAQQFFVYWDNTGTTGAYSIEETDTLLTTTTALKDTDDTVVAAAAITLPAFISNGDLGSPTTFQFVKVVITAAEVGKDLHVITGGDLDTQGEIDIYPSAADATAGTNVVATCDDFGPTDCLTPALTAAGTYIIQFQPSTELGSTDENDFIAAAFLQADAP